MTPASWTVVLALLASLVTGCVGSEPGGQEGLVPSGARDVVIEVTPPIELTGEEAAFEPSIAVGPEGTVYATAAPTERPTSGSQLSSYLWYSADGGASWAEVPSPLDAHEALPGFEGDIAVDAEGRLYFVDINLADTILHRWGPGPAWELSRPLATSIPVDDRPWLSAHGDGVVYLLLNNGASAPAPGNLAAGDARQGDKWLFVSEDAGLTWSPGHLIAEGGPWCQLQASRADDQTLLVACHSFDGSGSTARVLLSGDRGASFEEVHGLSLSQGASFLVPGAAVDRAGNLYAAFLDDEQETEGVQDWVWTGSESGQVRYTVSTDGGNTWIDHDITPFEARFSTMHAAAGREGTLALTFYATEDLTPDEGSAWYPYLMVSANATGGEPTWSTVRLLDEPAGRGATPPRDFFQNDVGPDNAVHVILQRDKPFDLVRDGALSGIPADILYVQQVSGPNLDG